MASQANSNGIPTASIQRADREHKKLERDPGYTSGKVCSLIRELRGVPTGRKAILFCIGSRYPNAWAAMETLGAEAGMSARQARSHVRAIEATGIFQCASPCGFGGGRNTSNQYVLDVARLEVLVKESKLRKSASLTEGKNNGSYRQGVTEISDTKKRMPTSVEQIYRTSHPNREAPYSQRNSNPNDNSVTGSGRDISLEERHSTPLVALKNNPEKRKLTSVAESNPTLDSEALQKLCERLEWMWSTGAGVIGGMEGYPFPINQKHLGDIAALAAKHGVETVRETFRKWLTRDKGLLGLERLNIGAVGMFIREFEEYRKRPQINEDDYPF